MHIYYYYHVKLSANIIYIYYYYHVKLSANIIHIYYYYHVKLSANIIHIYYYYHVKLSANIIHIYYYYHVNIIDITQQIKNNLKSILAAVSPNLPLITDKSITRKVKDLILMKNNNCKHCREPNKF